MMTEAGGDPLARSLKGAIGPDDWLEHVPRETRAYVSRILGPVARRRRKSRRG